MQIEIIFGEKRIFVAPLLVNLREDKPGLCELCKARQSQIRSFPSIIPLSPIFICCISRLGPLRTWQMTLLYFILRNEFKSNVRSFCNFCLSRAEYCSDEESGIVYYFDLTGFLNSILLFLPI